MKPQKELPCHTVHLTGFWSFGNLRNDARWLVNRTRDEPASTVRNEVRSSLDQMERLSTTYIFQINQLRENSQLFVCPADPAKLLVCRRGS